MTKATTKPAKGTKRAKRKGDTKAKRTRRAWGGSVFTRAGRPGKLFIQFRDPATGRLVQRRAANRDDAQGYEEAERLLAVVTGARAEDIERGVRAVSVRRFVIDEFLPTFRARVAPAHAENVASHLLGKFKGHPTAPTKRRREPTASERDEQRVGGFAASVADIALHEVTTRRVETYLAALRSGPDAVSPATCARVAASISAMMRAAVDAGSATANPVLRVKLARAQTFEPVVLTAADVENILGHASPRERVALTLLADLGLRLGELLELTWQRVAPDCSSVTVARSKSGKSRVVPTTPRARDLLLELRGERVAQLRGTDYVLPGKGRSKSTVQRAFRRAAEAAGLPIADGETVGVRTHDLRHAYASQLARNGVALSVVASLIGDSLMVTSARYARHVPASVAAAAVATLAQPAARESNAAEAQ